VLGKQQLPQHIRFSAHFVLVQQLDSICNRTQVLIACARFKIPECRGCNKAAKKPTKNPLTKKQIALDVFQALPSSFAEHMLAHQLPYVLFEGH